MGSPVARFCPLAPRTMPLPGPAAVRPYPTSFVLHGPDATLVRFNDAEAGAGLSILGYWRAGSFDLMVDRIDPLEPPKK